MWVWMVVKRGIGQGKSRKVNKVVNPLRVCDQVVIMELSIIVRARGEKGRARLPRIMRLGDSAKNGRVPPVLLYVLYER
jgi:hypothetical protein